MVYLDYSATTPINDEVLDTYVKVSKNYIGNPNSLHSLGIKSKNLIDLATSQIKEVLCVPNYEVIYTSGSSESNNLALKGIALKYKNRGNHIITTPLEHSSVVGPLNYLSKNDFKIDIVDLNIDGTINIDSLKRLLNNETLIVSISVVDSELGIRQNIEEIGKILKQYPKCFFHIDATQAIGKINVDFSDVDLVSLSSHKFYGPKGIGLLLKKDSIVIDSQINGGKSTTKYRSGTPATPLIVSMAKALRLICSNINKNFEYINHLNKYLRDNLSKYTNVHINSTDKSIPHILNFSISGIKPETFLHALEEKDIFISTKSACSSSNSFSSSVMSVTKNEEYSNHSLRISLSYLTTMDEITYFLKMFDECYNHLLLKGD